MKDNTLEQCRYPAFGTLARINRIKVRHGYQPLTLAQYEKARARYYVAHPDAVKS